MLTARIVIAALIAAAPLAASATTLQDGSFEIKGGALPVTDYCYDGFATPGGPACAAGAWVGGGVIRTGSGPWGGTVTPDGNYYGFVQGQSVVSQTFTATANETGVFSWIDTNRTNNGGNQSYDVTLTSGMSVINIGSFTSSIGGWVSRTSSSFALVNGSTYTLNFVGLFNGDRTTFIDSVSLATAGVPEASTWAMLLAGFGLVGFAARRRRVVAA